MLEAMSFGTGNGWKGAPGSQCWASAETRDRRTET